MKRPPEAFRSPGLFETGCGYVVVSRFKGDGRVETGFFMLDIYCLGVKDAGFSQFRDDADLKKSLLDPLFRDEEPTPLTPDAARKLVEGAVAYARGFGFAPSADFKKAGRVFGGISSADCEEEFVFGKDGKPFYIQGPSEQPASRDRILRLLEASCGPGGYEYLVLEDDFDPRDDADEFDDDGMVADEDDTDSDDSTALRAMADRMRADTPGLEVRINPSGRRKLSDMLSIVAEPLLRDAVDYLEKKTILTIAATAWNFTLFEASEQKGALEHVEELLEESVTSEMFALLAARKIQLFPDEKRPILKIETEPDAFGDINLRVASAMQP
jgi:hypothetical protein